MSGIVAEASGETLEGTDQALSSSRKPAVEVTFEVSKPGDGRPLDPDSGRASRIAAGIRKMRELGSTTGKVDPLKVETAKPAEAKPEEKPADPPKVEDPAAEQPADEGKEDAAPAAEAAPEVEPEATEDPPAEEAKPEDEPESKLDPVELATLKADLAERERELSLLRADLDRSRSGGPSDDDRNAWIENPIGTLRERVASYLGVKPDAKEVSDELAHLQRELTIEALGADSLADERKHQRITEQTSRRWQLTQQVRTASQETSKQAQQRKQFVEQVASVAEAVSEDFPFLSLVPEMYPGQSIAEAADTLWTAEASAGRIKPAASYEANLREALRLLNDHVKTKLDRVTARQPKNTAPAPATAPAQASAKEAAPGAPAAKKSTAPVKGSATPKTLSATQAAAAPIAKKEAPPERKPAGPITVDPHDRDGREARLKAIIQKRLAK